MLNDSFKTFSAEDALEARILPPPTAKIHIAEAADVEEEQEFLKRAQQLLGTAGISGDPTRSRSYVINVFVCVCVCVYLGGFSLQSFSLLP